MHVIITCKSGKLNVIDIVKLIDFIKIRREMNKRNTFGVLVTKLNSVRA